MVPATAICLQEVAQVAFDGRFGILLALATPVVAWVLFNIGVRPFSAMAVDPHCPRS